MMNFLRKHMRKIFIVTVVAFLGGTFMGGGAYLFGPAKDFDSIANINGSKIPVKTFVSIYRASVDMYRNATKESPTPELLEKIKVEALQSFVQEELFYQESLNYAILVSNAELKNDIQSSPMFRNNQNLFDSNAYYSFLKAINMIPKDYENIRRKQISGEKLKLLLASPVKVSDSEYEFAVAEGNTMTRDEMLQVKGNKILNKWFDDIVKESKIVINESIFAQI